jgi:radical SAM superfamily enzyme YgiQ (UPF0313 family)
MTTARILLIGAEDEENLAIRSIGAYCVAQGHCAKIAGCSAREHFGAVVRTVKEFRPNLIAVSLAFQRLAELYFDLIAAIRRNGYRGHIIVGGHFPTFEYEPLLAANPGIDSVGRFEGERTVAALAGAIVHNESFDTVPHLVYRRDVALAVTGGDTEFPDLDTFPWPMREARPQQRLGEKFSTLISSRGCWHASCLYCCIGAFHRGKEKKVAFRSVDDVASEIAHLVNRYGVRVLQFHDDNFVRRSPKATIEHLGMLRAAMARNNVDLSRCAFLIKARPDTIDADVAAALKQFGVTGVFLGVENAHETGLRSLLRGTPAELVGRAFEELRRQKIAVTFNLLIFHPRATMEEIETNIGFMQTHADTPLDFGRAEIVAGSPLERLVRQKATVRGSWPHWDYVIDDPAVERLCRLNLATFRGPGSPYSKTAHGAIALGYHAAVIERFYPGPIADSLSRRCTAHIREWNRTVCGLLRELVRIGSTGSLPDAIDSLRTRIHRASEAFGTQTMELTRLLLRYQTASKVFSKMGVAAGLYETEWVQRVLGIAPSMPEVSETKVELSV